MMEYISFLRGVNVGGRKIRMDDLRELYISLGLKDVSSYIQSGNIIFNHPRNEDLVSLLENKIMDTFGFEVSIIIRKRSEMEKIVEENPFLEEDVSKLHITFLKESPQELPKEYIDQIKDNSEKYSIKGKEIYLFLPNGYGRTKLSNNFFEKKLKVTATTRNFKTTRKLLDMMKSKN
jgi:uncharacterized protein (DUF1697 family)